MRALCRDYCQSNYGFAYWSLAFESKPIFATRSAPLQEERNKESAAELRHIVGGGLQKRGFRASALESGTHSVQGRKEEIGAFTPPNLSLIRGRNSETDPVPDSTVRVSLPEAKQKQSYSASRCLGHSHQFALIRFISPCSDSAQIRRCERP
jgi:hypothetical protein